MFEYSYQFDRFWKEFPKKEGKGAAHRAWEKIVAKWNGGEVAFADMVILHLVERKKTDAKWLEGKYVPQPATFLNQHRWHDEYVRVRQHKTGGTGGHIATDEENKIAYVRDCIRRGWPIPADHLQYEAQARGLH